MTNLRFLLALLLPVTCHAAWAQLPVGGEFQVNSYTGAQYRPAVASDANGNIVVVWDSLFQPGYVYGISGQRFNASGLPQGSEFQVNSYTYDAQRPKVASDANGNFVVVWESWSQDGDIAGVFGQRFNASGLPQGSEFQVNSYTTGVQYLPAVASDASGNFVVVWVSSGQDGSYDGVFGQRFNASGLPQGSEFQVNSYTSRWQTRPAVASDPTGNFVVVWDSLGQDGSGWGLFGQRFDASGLAQGSEFQVSSYTTDWQTCAAVTSAASGNFVVVWHSFQDGSGFSVFGRRFNAVGLPQGSEFQINYYTLSNQYAAAVASGAGEDFVVVWDSFGQDGSLGGVFGRRFDTSGLPQGSEFQVNSYTTGYQMFPAVASDSNGNFVVAWGRRGQAGSGHGIFGQRYSVDLIFRDGFQ